MKLPTEVLNQWVVLFNQGNAKELAELYHVDAANHQVANATFHGRDAIRDMFVEEFRVADMTCIVENIFSDGEWAILEWKDPKGLRGCGFFHIVEGKIKLQRGYWDKLSFLRQQGLPIPKE